MKKERKNFRFTSGVIVGMIIGSATIVCANQAIQALQNTEIKVSLNGQVQTFKDETTGETQYPITYNDRTYLPLRNVAQLAGLSVDYDVKTNTAILSNSNSTNKKDISFETDTIYSKEIGERTGFAEYCYFTKDSYYWHADSSVEEEYKGGTVTIAAAGKWSIQDGKLVLHELAKVKKTPDGYDIDKVDETVTKQLTFVRSFDNGNGGNSSEYTIENETWYSNAKDFNEEEIINSINSLINE